jgi:ribonucleoside-triphosphate reductase (thioredoxin)
MQFPIKERFTLTDSFLEEYKTKTPDFGFNGLGEFVFYRTYSRTKEDGTNEAWWETVKRVVEGIYSIQKQHIIDYNLGWNQSKAQRSAQRMYERIFEFKMLGSGRALWSMGAPVIMDKGMSAALYNCCFISTEKINENTGRIFADIADYLMLGIGVGADLKGAGKITVKERKEKESIFVIPDTREGWCEAIEKQFNSYFGGQHFSFDYSEIRPKGTPIKTFGGISGGYEPLEKLILGIEKTLDKEVGKPISETAIADIINMIGVAVVSGNVRRSAEILLGEPTDEFFNLKDYKINPDRKPFGWSSNNSIYGTLGMDYSKIAEKIADNGEPAVVWMENVRAFGRMGEPTTKDTRVMGFNPCGEIALESYELCNLVETFPERHENLEDYKTTLKYAYLFAKTVTLLNTHNPETNKVMLRNRRIGLSMSGIAQFITNRGYKAMKEWMNDGYKTVLYYDKVYSEWFAVPESKKVTTVKPSGTLSLLAGATAGIHFPESRYYIRRVRLSATSPLVKALSKAKYKVEPASEDPDNTFVVEFPVGLGDKIQTLGELSLWEQMENAAFAQENWADNSVSVTVTFTKKEKAMIKNALGLYQFRLKAVSFLPQLAGGAYPQMPYEEITQEEYEKMVSKLKPIDFSVLTEQASGEAYCSNDVCTI